MRPDIIAPAPLPAENPVVICQIVKPINAAAHMVEHTIRIKAACLAGTPQQYIRPVANNLDPSAGYMGKKTLKRKRATLS
mmetsp:Transcript_61249/g.106542  ORF Transcript_61249/g.106542 Transcript_61249/m.106542 type:complete len:80 (-) Transcript_61249:45-284(-)